MLGGTVLVGLSGYVYFAVIGHGRFDPTIAAALAATYLLSNILGPGVFIAAEQEASRVISAQRAGAGVVRGTARRLALICVALGVLTTMVLAACAPVLLTNVLDGNGRTAARAAARRRRVGRRVLRPRAVRRAAAISSLRGDHRHRRRRPGSPLAWRWPLPGPPTPWRMRWRCAPAPPSPPC